MNRNPGAAPRARFVKKMKSNPASARRRAQRAAAYRAALRKGMQKNSARRSALRKVPFSSTERRAGSTFGGSKARVYRRNQLPMESVRKTEIGVGPQSGTRTKKPRSDKQRAAAQRNIKKAQAARKRKARKTAGKQFKSVSVVRRKKTKRGTRKVRATRRVRVKYGRYSRVRMTNPLTGKSEYSYMYRGKGRKLRRIPMSAISAGKKNKEKFADRVRKGRIRAARRLVKYGGPFVMNRNGKRKKARKGKKGGSAAQKRHARRMSVMRKAQAKGLSKKRARAAALRAVPLRGEDRFGGKVGRKASKRKRRVKASKKRHSKRGHRAVTTKQIRAARRNLKKARAARRRKSKSRKSGRKTKARKSTRRTKKMAANRKRSRRRRKLTGRRVTVMAANRKRSRRRRRGSKKLRVYVSNRRRRRGRKSYRRNSIGALFMTVMKTGGLITAGFLVHRVITNLAIDYLLPLFTKSDAVQPTSGWDLATFKKPIVGAVVLAVGLPVTSKVAKRQVMELGGGMFVSFFQSLISAVVSAIDTSGKVSAAIGEYQSSRAFQLRGRRGYSGLGARNAGQIMLRYAPVGTFRQAAAGTGTYRQAAAGTGWLGEYFQATGVGEYFAPAGTQGVGQYEPAGELALQATTVQSIDDGIRPDANLDVVMDLAESAAGVGRSPRMRGRRGTRGFGEYITAVPDNGGFAEATVPTSDQWIPNGPLWAGTLGVKDTQTQADLPAGTLAGPGGNGVLSG